MNEALALLGIPVRFESDDQTLARRLTGTYAAWRTPIDAAAPRPIQIVLISVPEEDRDAPDAITVEGPRLTLTYAGLHGSADAACRAGRCEVSPRLAQDPEALARDILDTILLFLLTRAGRVPVHASALLLDGRAVILAGRSGSGKSSLALAGIRSGLPVLSEDTVYVRTEPSLRVFGLPRAIHLLPQDAPADAATALRLRAGRWKRPVPISGTDAAIAADRAVLVLLEPGEEVSLRPIDEDAALAWMAAAVEPGFDHFAAALPAVIAALAAEGAWTLTLSPDPSEAIHILRNRFGNRAV